MPRTQGNNVTIGSQTVNYFFIDWTETVNNSANTSTIAWSAYFRYTNSDAQLDDGDVNIGGGALEWDVPGRVRNFASNFTTRDHFLASGSVALAHDNSGGGSFNVSGSIFGSLSARSSASQNYSFTPIDRTPTTPSITSGLRSTDGLSFSAVASGGVNNSGPAVTWTLQRSTNNVDFTDISSTTTSGTTLTASGLLGSTVYYFRVRASNTVSSKFSSTITSFGVPTAPASLTYVKTGRNVALTATASSSAGGGTISSYSVQFRTSSDGGTTWGSWGNTQTMTALQYTYSLLPPALTYDFRVYSTNQIGNSPTTSIAAPFFIAAGGKRWNGTSFIPTQTAKRWSGTAWVDLTTAKRWNGTAWVDLS
jgi:hypothetical protein